MVIISFMKTEVVNSYKYLGICFTIKTSFAHACQDLVSRGKKTVVNILSKLHKLGNHSFDVFGCCF